MTRQQKYVENSLPNDLSNFVQWTLPGLKTEIILLTGKWALPFVRRDAIALEILKSKTVAFWVSQNPIFEHQKYGAIPYGIEPFSANIYITVMDELEIADEAWRKRNGRVKGDVLPRNESVLLTYITKENHYSRQNVPSGNWLPPINFYNALSKAQYASSPHGDRPDCFRHWEVRQTSTIVFTEIL